MLVDGRRLRELREQHHLRLIDVAHAASISKSYLSMLERGERRRTSTAVATRLADALNVAIGDLEMKLPRLRPRK